MRKLLLPTDKHLHFEFDPQTHTHIVTVRHSLRFMYAAQSVTIHLAHPQLEVLLEYLVIHTENNNKLRKVVPNSYISKLQMDETLKATIILDDVQLSNLELLFTLSASSLGKLIQILNSAKSTNVLGDSTSVVQIQQVLALSYLGCELNGFNLEIFQPLDSGIQLINLSQRLMREHRYSQAHLVTFHVAMIAKHKSKWKEAEQTLLSLSTKVDGPLRRRILLNLIDTALDSKTKIEYIGKIAETELELKPGTIFKHCGMLLEVILKSVEINNFMDFCCFLSIVTYFVNEVGCTIGDSLIWIFQTIISVFSNKKFWKRLRNQNEQNFMLAISSVDLLFQGVNCCALSFSPQYVSQLSYFLLDYTFLEETTLIRRPIILLVSSLVKQEVSCRLTFRQWYSILYYVEGQELLKHIELDWRLYSGKQARQQITLLEQEIKSTVLFNLSISSLKEFVGELSQHLVRMALSHDINFLALHHFLEVVNIFTVSCSEHNREIKPDFLAVLLPLYKPIKLLIYRLIDLRLQPLTVFGRAWDVFVQLCIALCDMTEESLLEIIIGVVNSHLLKPDINMHDIPYISTVCDSLHSYTSQSHKYVDIVQCAVDKIAKMLCNSIHTESIYSLMEKLIVFRPQMLNNEAVVLSIAAGVCDPYTDQDERWKVFIGSLCQRVVIQPTLQPLLSYLIARDPVRKSNFSQQKIKLQEQIAVRKLHVLSRVLKAYRDAGCRTADSKLQQSAEQLVGGLRNESQMRQLNIEFHKFYCMTKHLSLTGSELGCVYFQLFQMQYPPIVYSCLVLMASNRKLIPVEQYDSHFKVAMTEVSSPWKNIQEISLLLLAHFARPDNSSLPSVLTELLSADEVYKRLIGLSILNNLADQFDQLPSSSRYTSDIPELIGNISGCLASLANSYSIKQLELVVHYVHHKVCQSFRLQQSGVYQLSQEDEQRLKEVLSLEERIESIVSRQFSKDAQDYIKSQISLPRKTESQERSVDVQVETIHDTKIETKQQEIPVSVLATAKDNSRTPPEPIRPRQVVSVRKQPTKEPTKQPNKQPSKTKPKPVSHGSPIVEIKSNHGQKFKINLGHLKEKWRQSLEMIHKKPKNRKKT